MQINELLTSGAADVTDSSLDRNLALADLYGMYLLARNNAQGKEVAYRDADGKIKTHACPANSRSPSSSSLCATSTRR